MGTHLDEELSSYVNGELAADDRQRVETHLASCDECRATVDYLRRLVRRAGALPDQPPGRDLWAGIAARISTPPATVAATQPITPFERGRRFTFTVPQLAAAALVLAVATAGTAILLTRTPLSGGLAFSVAPAADARPAAGSATTGIASYDAAISELEQVLAAHRGRLDSATVRVIEQSLALVDAAISQAREALARDPDNLYLNGHLRGALDTKLVLLRRAVALPAI